MLNNLIGSMRAEPEVRKAFRVRFVVVALLVFTAASLLTYIFPRGYLSVARIKVAPNPSSPAAGAPASYDPSFASGQCEVIRSELVLGKVIEALDLNTAWGKKFADGHRLKTSETLSILRSRMDLQPISGADLIDIRVFSEHPDEAAAVANATVDAYREFCSGTGEHASFSRGYQVELVKRAVPDRKPIRPNIPLNLAWGAVVSLVLAAPAALSAALIAFLRKQNRFPRPSRLLFWSVVMSVCVVLGEAAFWVMSLCTWIWKGQGSWQYVALGAAVGWLLGPLAGGGVAWVASPIWQRHPRLAYLFRAGFTVTLLVVFVASTLVTFSLPESFESIAHVRLGLSRTNSLGAEEPQALFGLAERSSVRTESRLVESATILGPVIDGLDLNREWGKKFANNEHLKTAESLTLLKGRIDAVPFHGTGMLEIRAYSEKAEEAAKLANAAAEAYRDQCRGRKPGLSIGSGIRAEILDRAVPGARPVRPNKPLNCLMGISHAILLALLAGGSAAWAGFLFKEKHSSRSNVVLPLAVFGGLLVLGLSDMGDPLSLASLALVPACLVGLVFVRLAFLVWERYAGWTRVFFPVFAFVFLVVLLLGAFRAALLPEVFSAHTRIRLGLKPAERADKPEAHEIADMLDPSLIQAQCETIRSEAVLSQVVADVGLREAWGGQKDGRRLDGSGARAWLTTHMEAQAVPRTSLVDIRLVGPDATKAAKLANAVAQAYKAYCCSSSLTANTIFVEIVEAATPSTKPLPLHGPLAFLLSAGGAALLALALAAAAVWASAPARTRRTGTMKPAV
jgi:uncharacterized protein involved in exopolysaccharide biosynthesis